MRKSANMNKPALASGKPRNYEYPDDTKGTRIAKSIRKETSDFTDDKRSDLFKEGMRVIYGGADNEKVSRR